MTTNSEGSETSGEMTDRGRHALAEPESPGPALRPPRVVAGLGGDVWAGPVPPADLLARYAEISPDMPERIIRMVEEQNKYQMEQAMRIEKAERVSRRVSAAVMVLTAVFTVVTAWVLLSQEEDALALIVGLSTPVSACIVAAVFFRSARHQREAMRTEIESVRRRRNAEEK